MAGNFSEPVIQQFKQGGFRFFFRLTEEEAAHVSKQIAYDPQVQKAIYKKLVTFPRGHCLLMGPHCVGTSREISEAIRFVEVCAETELENRMSRENLSSQYSGFGRPRKKKFITVSGVNKKYIKKKETSYEKKSE